MPVYCYQRPDGDYVEKIFSMGEAPDAITCEDGAKAERDVGEEVRGRSRRANCQGWPVESRAAGLRPEQVTEDGQYANEEMRRKHPDHEFNPKTGDMVFRSNAQKRRQLQDIGMRATDSFLG